VTNYTKEIAPDVYMRNIVNTANNATKKSAA
jgi:hypothetical protein